MRQLLFLIAIIFGVFGFTNYASSEELKCGPQEKIIEFLKTKYGEVSAQIGIVSNNHVIEIFISPKKTWTMIKTDTKGISCYIMSGSDWESYVEKGKDA